MEIKGIDTIDRAIGEWPQRIELDFNAIKKAEEVREQWNIMLLGFIPYCLLCKEPLVWHSPPSEDGVLFHCPNCKREWVKEGSWKRKAKKYCSVCEEKKRERIRTKLGEVRSA